MARPKRQNRERDEVKSEFDQRVLDVRRTARVVKGGRRFSFRATVIVGDRGGRVGMGMGKGSDVASAVEKGVSQAKKHLLKLSLSGHTIPYEVEAKFSAARVRLKPAREGHGLVAGGPVRVIADLAGIKDLTSKILSRTPNKLNNARAVFEALKKFKSTQ